MAGTVKLFSLSHAQRAALYGIIEGFGLEVSNFFSESKCRVEFFAHPTDDGIGYNKATRDCKAALMAVCGGSTADDWSSYNEPSPHSGGVAFKDGYRRIIAVDIKREPFPSLSQYGQGI